MLFDTHCHLDFPDFDTDRSQAIERARSEDVGYLLNVGSSLEASARSLSLSRRYEFIYSSLGIHPNYADSADSTMLSEIKSMAGDEKVIAIGEVGLDYYRMGSGKEAQRGLFRDFIRMAGELDLPLIVHNRDAGDDTLSLLAENSRSGQKAVMHCFSQDRSFLKRCLDAGLHVSFTANVTFKNASCVRDAASYVPLGRFFLETDSPFLAPQAARGRRNEPAYVKYVAEEIARLRKKDVSAIAEHTTACACSFFNIKRENG